MAGLPSQTIKSAFQTLKTVIKLRPEMIHVHPFYPTISSTFIQKGQRLSEQNMEIREKIVLMSQRLIQKAGYKPIKFDADGENETARNIQLSDAIEYNAPFLGLGAGAVSHATNYVRYVNTTDINEYINKLNKGKLPILSGCHLTKKDEMIYFVTSSLRYGTVDKFRFRKLFNIDLNSVFPEEIIYLKKRNKIIDNQRFIVSKMRNIGEYLIYSKYFYDKKLIFNFRKGFLNTNIKRKLKEKDIRYMLL